MGCVSLDLSVTFDDNAWPLTRSWLPAICSMAGVVSRPVPALDVSEL